MNEEERSEGTTDEPRQPAQKGHEEAKPERLTGAVPGPSEFREGFEGENPENYQPPFPGTKPKPGTTQQALEPAPPPEETPQD